MHDDDMFARMPASGSAGQPPMERMLLSFEEEREVVFKGEVYLVRDNGAVRRRARKNGRRRRLDDIWTFGSLNKQTGYQVVSDHVVHRIVATAFHGPCPSTDHVVDHIDTNRRNNRAENLRWVTRLENVLLNPITLRRIELAFGSIEAFLANPRAHAIPNCGWMRPVTKEEAADCRARLLKWAKEGKTPIGGVLGDWLFSPRDKPVPEPKPEPLDRPSLTTGALQRNWQTPTEFPLCPAPGSESALDAYLERLKKGSVFARNRYGDSTVAEAEKGADGSLSVVCHSPSGIKDWTVARLFIEGGMVCHESGGAFFTKKGALKAHLRALGVPFDEALYESIDDNA